MPHYHPPSELKHHRQSLENHELATQRQVIGNGKQSCALQLRHPLPQPKGQRHTPVSTHSSYTRVRQKPELAGNTLVWSHQDG